MNNMENTAKDMLSYIKSRSILLKQALEDNNQERVKKLIVDLKKQNLKLYRKAKREKEKEIVKRTKFIAVEIRSIDRYKQEPDKCKGYIGELIKLSKKNPVELKGFNHEIEISERNNFIAYVKNNYDATLVTAGSTVNQTDAIVSNKPLYSYGYYKCRAFILVQNNIVGLSHMPPNANINQFMNYILSHFQGKVKAYLLEFEDTYNSDLIKCCNNHNVNIIEMFKTNDNVCSRQILIIPEHRALQIHTRKGIIKRRW